MQMEFVLHDFATQRGGFRVRPAEANVASPQVFSTMPAQKAEK
jgi:hypothetical protein